MGKYQLPIIYDDHHWTIRREVRNQYVEEQNGLCWFCGGDLYDLPQEDINKLWINMSLFPKDMLKYPIHLHHNRKTGYTIGAVHSKCNAVLWQYCGE